MNALVIIRNFTLFVRERVSVGEKLVLVKMERINSQDTLVGVHRTTNYKSKLGTH